MMRKLKLYDADGKLNVHEIPEPSDDKDELTLPEPEVIKFEDLIPFFEPKLPSETNRAMLYRDVDMINFKKLLKARDSDSRTRLESVIERAIRNGNMREIACIPSDWVWQLDCLEDEFPNFHCVIDSMRDQFALMELDNYQLAMPPTLLNGPAGVGKTEFLNRFSEIIGVPVRFIDMATAQSESVLSGSDAHWSNSREGAVFETLVYGQYINPVIVLDELEKNTNRYGSSPTNGLYTLLEPATARRFTDSAIRDVPIDASRVNWIAISNDKPESAG